MLEVGAEVMVVHRPSTKLLEWCSQKKLNFGKSFFQKLESRTFCTSLDPELLLQSVLFTGISNFPSGAMYDTDDILFNAYSNI